MILHVEKKLFELENKMTMTPGLLLRQCRNNLFVRENLGEPDHPREVPGTRAIFNRVDDEPDTTQRHSNAPPPGPPLHNFGVALFDFPRSDRRAVLLGM